MGSDIAATIPVSSAPDGAPSIASGVAAPPRAAVCDFCHCAAERDPVVARFPGHGGRWGGRKMDEAMHDSRSTLAKMLAGERHLAPDPELIAIGNRARALLRTLNDLPRERAAERAEVLRDLFGGFGRSWIETPFTVDYGVHTTIG